MDLAIPLTDAARATPDRVGPKAATLARLKRAGLPVPDGFCLTAEAYRAQLRAAGVEVRASGLAHGEGVDLRRRALDVKLGFQRAPLEPTVSTALAAAWRRLMSRPASLAAVRSSALLEDTPTASFAGQFDSFFGIATEAELVTAVRACWAALWATRALRYMEVHGVDPAQTAMAVLVQHLVEARAAGGALSRTADGDVLLTGTWGLGSAVAQGEVVPDRFVVRRDGALAEVEPGRKDRLVLVSAEAGLRPRAVARELVEAPCLDAGQVRELAGMVLAAEAVLRRPVEVEWALGAEGLQILQARPLRVEPRQAPDELWLRHPGLRGQPAGVGWGSGPARIVLSEHDLEHVEPGEVLVTQVAGPALTAVLPWVAGVVAELGGSTSHLAALARERAIPTVLGVAGATRRIPEGAIVAVDGVAGVVRWVS
ncbi:MAG: pyruvate, phosphate dikinase [Candidatus Rokubacteria bacterium]|nr:pyruvate, phosphate dikinase [Candidatus Rokubacteria bacterium]